VLSNKDYAKDVNDAITINILGNPTGLTYLTPVLPNIDNIQNIDFLVHVDIPIWIYLTNGICSYWLWETVKKLAANTGIKKRVYPHKFRISAITHMTEAGLSVQEMTAFSGHRSMTTLIGYIQHCPSRIRQSYEKAFQDTEQHETTRENNEPVGNNEHWKTEAIKKYLAGDMDQDMLHTILTEVGKKEDEKIPNTDSSYA